MNPRVSKSPQHFKNLGKIQVDCCWARETTAATRAPDLSAQQTDNTPIPEKCLKGAAISAKTK
jgi:hypothetical protein